MNHNTKHDFVVVGANTLRRVFIHQCKVCGIKALEHFDNKGNLEYNIGKMCKPKETVSATDTE